MLLGGGCQAGFEQCVKMVYIEHWDDFFAESHRIYLAAPTKVASPTQLSP